MRRQKLYFNQLLLTYSRYSAKLYRLVAGDRNLRKQVILRKKLQNMHGTLLGLQKSIRLASTAAAVAGSLVIFQPLKAQAQVFIQQTGSANPFNGVDIGLFSAPAFVNIDDDGDIDAFIGEELGTIVYYKNTGTASSSIFTMQTGTSNPFNGIDIGFNSISAFVNIDGDGDMDVFIGNREGTISYYKNTGTASAPVFTIQTGASNPLNGVDVGQYSTPAFVDIDGDGDKDVFIGESLGSIRYYKNTGTSSLPVFTAQTGTSNPFNGVNEGEFSAPAMVDIDGDGDMDAFIGALSGNILYYKNTGTPSASAFTEQTAASNPFNGVNVGGYSTPVFADIDGDGDKDAFIGEMYGSILYYKNTQAASCINPTSGGTIAASQTICNGVAPAAFTSQVPASGQTGTLEYKWQLSTAGPSTGFGDIGASNSETYAPGSLTVTSWFKRLAQVTCMGNWGGAAESNVLQITVRPVFTAGAISSTGQTTCFNENPGIITSSINASGGNGTITYQWQSSLTSDFASPQVISNNAATYDPPAGITTTTWYRRQAKDGTCNTIFITSAGVWQVAVHPIFVVGSVSASQAICSNNTPTQLTGTAPTGGNAPYAYQWQSSTDNVSFSDILNASSLDYQPGVLTQTMHFRQKQTSGNGCGTLTTNTVTITMIPMLTAGVSIAASENPVCEGTNVTFAATPINGGSAPTYQWYNGTEPVGSGGENYSFVPADGNDISVVMTSNASPCLAGSPATSNGIIMNITTVAETIEITGGIGNEQSQCYNAIQIINVGGGEASFTVDNGGYATMIAGHNINYLPGTRVHYGGYVHGYISDTFCCEAFPPMIKTTAEEGAFSVIARKSNIKIYPNPTAGNITLEQTGAIENGTAKVEIYTMRGEKMIAIELAGERKHEFNLSGLAAGVYFVKVIASKNTRTIKLVKTF